MQIRMGARVFSILVGLMILGVPLATMGLYFSTNTTLRYVSAGIVSFGVPIMGLWLLDSWLRQTAANQRPIIRVRILIWLLTAIGFGFLVFVLLRA